MGITALGSTPPFVLQDVFKEIPKRKYSKRLGSWTWKWVVVWYTIFLRTLVCSASGQ
jgi:hypothetical protein